MERILARDDVDCWIAPRDVEPGEAFDSAILSAINSSAGVLLLFCSQSDRSQHVKRELILADSARKAIIPLRIEDVVPHDLAYHLASAQWIDWLETRDEAIGRIAAKARQLAGLPAQPSPAASAAITDQLHGELAGIRTVPADSEPVPVMQPAAKPFPTAIVAIVALLLLVAVLGTVLLMRGGGEDGAAASGPAAGVVQASESSAPQPQAASTAPAAPSAAPADPSDIAPQLAPTVRPVSPPPVIAVPVEVAEPQQRAAIAPSFDCARAATRAERLICSDDELAALDREMARAYNQLNQIAKNRTRLTTDQRSWRVGVRDRCTDLDCVKEAMRDRIIVLDQYRAEVSGR